MEIFKQLGDVVENITNPEKIITGAKEELKEKAGELSNDIFKKALDSLGLTMVFEMLSKVFPVQNIFPFLTGTQETKEVKNTASTSGSWEGEYNTMLAQSKLKSGAIARFLNNKKPQSEKTACYNLAENFRWTQFQQNLFQQQPSFQNDKESEEMRASQYLKKEIDNLPQGTAVWVQANIDPRDTMSSNLTNRNHWITYLGKNQQGEPLIADQNGVRQIRDDDFWSKRYIHKIYPPVQSA